MPRPYNTPDLRGDRDRDILEHVARYRLTTPSILFKRFFEVDGVDDNAVTKVTSRLVERDFFRKFDLYASYKYFTLGKRGAKSVGINAKRVGAPLGREALYREFGTLHFCQLAPERRERLTIADIHRDYPELKHRGDNDHYYTEQGETDETLGYVWIDGGGDAAHVIRKVEQDLIGPRLAVPGLRQRMEQGHFILAIVTYLEDKKQQIAAAIHHHGAFQAPVRFRVEVVPELLPLIPDRSRG